MIHQPLSKSLLLDMMRVERQEWEEALFAIGAERMLCPGLEGDWSARDVVAHATAYERWLLEWLEATARGEAARPSVLDDTDMRRRDQAAHKLTLAFPLDLVLGDSWLTFERLSLAVERLPERDLEDLSRTPPFVQRHWGEWTSLGEAIATLTYEHYREHLPALRAWACEEPMPCAG
ncbi:MAG TPA: hypothetical protein VFQ25_07905 [Ktedonobacterales bacterium]|nr:hypothetical protein [Ktedonobacterales bacterium]